MPGVSDDLVVSVSSLCHGSGHLHTWPRGVPYALMGIGLPCITVRCIGRHVVCRTCGKACSAWVGMLPIVACICCFYRCTVRLESVKGPSAQGPQLRFGKHAVLQCTGHTCMVCPPASTCRHATSVCMICLEEEEAPIFSPLGAPCHLVSPLPPPSPQAILLWPIRHSSATNLVRSQTSLRDPPASS